MATIAVMWFHAVTINELAASNSSPGNFLWWDVKLCSRKVILYNQSCLQVFSRTNELLVANLTVGFVKTVDELSAQPGLSRAADDSLLVLIRRPMTKRVKFVEI